MSQDSLVPKPVPFPIYQAGFIVRNEVRVAAGKEILSFRM